MSSAYLRRNFVVESMEQDPCRRSKQDPLPRVKGAARITNSQSKKTQENVGLEEYHKMRKKGGYVKLPPIGTKKFDHPDHLQDDRQHSIDDLKVPDFVSGKVFERNANDVSTRILVDESVPSVPGSEFSHRIILPPITGLEKNPRLRQKTTTQSIQKVNPRLETKYDQYMKASYYYEKMKDSLIPNQTEKSAKLCMGDLNALQVQTITREEYFSKSDLDFRSYKKRKKQLADPVLDSFLKGEYKRRRFGICVEVDAIYFQGTLMKFCHDLAILTAIQHCF